MQTKKSEAPILLDSFGIDTRRAEYGHSLYLLGLILMVVVALVAQTISSISPQAVSDQYDAVSSRELQTSPEVGN